jgi:hypothetical protein
MYKVYYTDPKLPETPMQFTTNHLEVALKATQRLRGDGMQFVTLVSDYANMIGEPGAHIARPGEVASQLRG